MAPIWDVARERNSRFAMAAFIGVVVGFAVATVACGGPHSSDSCSRDTCAGCCDPSGICVESGLVNACGLNGQSCEQCQGETVCQSGECVPSADPRDAGIDGGADAGLIACEAGGSVCGPGHWCERGPDLVSGTCRPLLIATGVQTLNPSFENVMLVPFNQPDAHFRVGDAGHDVAFPRWSPDGKRLAVGWRARDGAADLRVFSIGDGGISGDALNLVEDSHAGYYAPDFGAAGIAWREDLGGVLGGVRWVPVDGGPVQSVSDGGGGGGPKWVSDGHQLVFQGQRGITLVGVDDGGQRVLPGTIGDADPSVNPAGTRIVVIRGTSFPDLELWVMTLDGGGQRRLVGRVLQDGANPEQFLLTRGLWSPRGQWIAFTVQRNLDGLPCTPQRCGGKEALGAMLLKVDPDTGAPLGEPIEVGSGSQPVVSPDERLVAFVQLRTDSLYVQEIDADGGLIGEPIWHYFPSRLTGNELEVTPQWQPLPLP